MKGKELKGEELVQGLIRGSAEIDRMRKEIDNVVRMIQGFLFDAISNAVTCRRDFSWKSNDGSLHGTWQVYFSRDGCRVEFIIRSYHVYDSNEGARRIPLPAVRHVYVAMGALADGIKDSVSSLNERWRPLLDAAAAAK